MFIKAKQSAFHFISALLFCLLLMVADFHYQRIDKLRSGFALLVTPLWYAVDYPIRVVGWIQSLTSSKKTLVDENMKLRHQQVLLEAQLQKMLLLRHENSQLKELLMTTARNKTQAMAAQIVAVDTGHTRQVLILNKGRRHGVYTGQPVLDAKGVVGQIIDVGSITSTVLLISDAKSAVPVQNNRTGERAILTGTNDNNALSLINLPKTSTISVGDLLVTSGLGRRYPEGYPVGKVQTIRHIPGEEFIQVTVTPMALLNRNQLVLLVWPEKEYALLTRQIDERMHKIA